MNLLRKLKVYSQFLSRREKRIFFPIVLLMLVSAGLETLSVGAIFPLIAVIDAPSTSQANQNILYRWIDLGKNVFGNHLIVILGAGILLTFLIKNLCGYYLIVVQNNFVYKGQARTQIALYERYLHAPYAHHLNYNSADLIRNITSEVTGLYGTILRTFFTIIIDLIMVIAMSLFLLFVSPYATLGMFCGLVLFAYGFNLAFKKRLTTNGKIRQEEFGKMIRWIHQGLGGIREIKVLKREDFFINGFRKAVVPYTTVESHGQSFSQIPKLFFELLTVFIMIPVIVISFLHNPSSHSIVPLIAMYSLAGIRLTPAFNRLLGSSTALRYYKPALDMILSEFNRLDQKEPSLSSDVSQVPLVKEGLSLENVSYRYLGSNQNALNQLSLAVGAHDVVGIIGESGAGKTTLVNIMLGLIRPTTGSVFMDGFNLGDTSTDRRCLVGYVPQDVYLTDDTIRNNVAYGVPEEQIDETKIWEALQLAQLDSFVSSLPDGSRTLVGERGARISGGQKQRIGIARALYANPRLLILDEPTSALDAETEKEIASSIGKISHNKMVVIVTHRQGLLEHCTRVLRMTQGVLEEMRVNPFNLPKKISLGNALL